MHRQQQQLPTPPSITDVGRQYRAARDDAHAGHNGHRNCGRARGTTSIRSTTHIRDTIDVSNSRPRQHRCPRPTHDATIFAIRTRITYPHDGKQRLQRRQRREAIAARISTIATSPVKQCQTNFDRPQPQPQSRCSRNVYVMLPHVARPHAPSIIVRLPPHHLPVNPPQRGTWGRLSNGHGRGGSGGGGGYGGRSGIG